MADATPWALPEVDLRDSLAHSEADLKTWSGSRLLITGGTGFIGSWLVASLLHANAELNLDLHITAITRDPSAVPLASDDHLALVRADVRSLPSLGTFDFAIHGAASSSVPFGAGDGAPGAMAATIYEGAQSIIEVLANSKARVLFLSSGAIYGPQTAPVDEGCLLGPDPTDARSAYGAAKRLAETLFCGATKDGAIDGVIARLFSFIGPRLPLDAHYAAGNFLADVLAHRPIAINGDGRPRRSYLYVGDLPEWCWALITRGASATAYNVGSPEAITIAQLAEHVARLGTEPVAVQVAERDQVAGPAPWYVPIVERARHELDLAPRVSLDEALRKFHAWHAGR